MIHRCYIGLGANLDDPVRQLSVALKALANMPGCTLVECSSFYGSKPVGPQDQPDYVNAVAAIDTRLSPEALLDELQAQEQQQGRVKLRHWGERCIDLDLLLYGNRILASERLTIPHSQMKLRSFVLLPLQEIAPALILPDGDSLAALCTRIRDNIHQGTEEPLIRLSPPVNSN
jgi:2-amino-4-hydroxy-6-hydroxymethyldihydropteridine diphosphokinase